MKVIPHGDKVEYRSCEEPADLRVGTTLQFDAVIKRNPDGSVELKDPRTGTMITFFDHAEHTVEGQSVSLTRTVVGHEDGTRLWCDSFTVPNTDGAR